MKNFTVPLATLALVSLCACNTFSPVTSVPQTNVNAMKNPYVNVGTINASVSKSIWLCGLIVYGEDGVIAAYNKAKEKAVADDIIDVYVDHQTTSMWFFSFIYLQSSTVLQGRAIRYEPTPGPRAN